ncbi:UDP-glucose 4-epimerase GalE [Indioceanicola profundi]|uniref:UDP-glucose 4-epimerase GalE n=1 Tax=Indioceanicola profundi TaxID=2220096 RepID=UPI000E6A9720|nr:UDP-glucose 4-epimerase GalE [Indioceanicola profundi]
MTTVLVTGGAGYIGSHACKALAAAGYVPVTFDNLSTGHRSAVRWGPFEYGDLKDLPRLQEVIRTWRPAAVMHFAASAYVGESVADPASYWRNNVQGSATLLEAMRLSGIEALVFSSTCATYGNHDSLINEATPQRPCNPYGRTKLAVEWMIGDHVAAYALRAVCLRYFNAAGADPDGELGEDHDPEPHLIPRILMAAAGRLPAVEIFGTALPTPDGTPIRDYIHVSDLADAHVAALKYLSGAAGFHAFNLGTGRGTSVLAMIEAAEQVTRRTIPRLLKPQRPGDPVQLVADAGAARTVLGLRTSRSSPETLIATAWPWFSPDGDRASRM